MYMTERSLSPLQILYNYIYLNIFKSNAIILKGEEIIWVNQMKSYIET